MLQTKVQDIFIGIPKADPGDLRQVLVLISSDYFLYFMFTVIACIRSPSDSFGYQSMLHMAIVKVVKEELVSGTKSFSVLRS